jgi:CRISPR system Cascade subunit CasA
MSYSFNLVDSAWIPCLTREGKYVEVGLFDLLTQAHHLKEIYGETPLVTAAIFPVALAVLHRVFGPRDRAQWQTLWKQGAFDEARLEAYFRQWYERFELLGEGRRFYQERDSRVKPKSTLYLVHTDSHSRIVFKQPADEVGENLKPAQAARQLITAQYFRIGGLSGIEEKFTDSIFARGVLFFAEGDTLFETLMFNLLPYPSDVAMRTTPNDKPCWEMDEDMKERPVPLGYLDYLTWQNKRFWLFPEETQTGELRIKTITVAPGRRIISPIFSPLKSYRSKSRKNEEFSAMYFSDEKALWRDYHSLLTINSDVVKPPAIVSWLATISLSVELPHTRLMAIGMHSVSGQDKPIFYRQERMSLPQALLRDETGKRLEAIKFAISKAGEVESVARDAVKRLAREVLQRGGEGDPDPAKVNSLLDQWNATSIYWAALEAPFWELVDRIARDDEGASAWWQADVLRPSADEMLSYAETLAGTDPGALKGGVSARRILNFGLKKTLD